MTYKSFANWIDWFSLPHKQYQQFEQLFDIINKQNQHINTTRILNEEDFFVKNIFDSLLISKIFPEIITDKRTLADIGCGGGFPCLPLAIANPQLNISAIDSNNKKVSAVSEIAEKLKLPNLITHHIRAREAGRKENFSFDIVTARAVAETHILIKECRQLINPTGKMIFYKTPQQFDKEKKLIERETSNYNLKFKCSEILTLPKNYGQRIFLTLYK